MATIPNIVRGFAEGIDNSVGNTAAAQNVEGQFDRQRANQDQAKQFQVKARSLAIGGLQQRLSQVDPQKDPAQYHELVSQIQEQVHGMREVLNPDQKLGPSDWLKTHTTDWLHITNHDKRVRQLQQQQEAGAGQDQQTAQALAQGAPQAVNPFVQKYNQAMQVPGATPEGALRTSVPGMNPKSEGENFKVQTITLPDGRTITAQQDTHSGKWLDLNGKPIPEDMLAGAKIATKPPSFKPGVQLNQGVPYGWTSPDGKQYASSDPNIPDAGKNAIGDALKAYLKSKGDKSSGKVSGLALYTVSRMMSMGYNDNPAMLGAMGEFAKAAGINLPPETIKLLSQVPLDQPLSPTTGEPIGRQMPGAPTGSTRAQAQVAQRVISELPRIKEEVNAAASSLGPVKGRVLMDYLLGRVGSTGDDATDQKLNQLRTDLTFMGSASSKFHINSVRQAELFDSLIASGKSTAPAIQGFLGAVEDWAKTAAAQQRGYGEQGTTSPPAGTVHFVDGNRPFDIPAALVNSFKKDHPNAKPQ